MTFAQEYFTRMYELITKQQKKFKKFFNDFDYHFAKPINYYTYKSRFVRKRKLIRK